MDNAPVTDEQIALSVQQGNSEALAHLVERHYGSLVGYLYRMLNGNRLLAEDLAQETFLRALRAIDRYHYPRSFKAWLYAIATNLARSHYDRAETRYVMAGDETLERLTDDGEGIEDNLIQQADQNRVAGLLAELPDQQREALILRYAQGLSIAEIASVQNVPAGTVKSRVWLGLARLKTLMDSAR